jgi:hypothetical protein
MSQVFISYRRNDSPIVAGRVYDRLIQHFGRERVFKDLDSIPGGATFPEVLAESLDKCDAVLVLIGEHWLEESKGGKRRLDDPADFVRREIESGLQRGILVIPLLIDNATMPEAKDLPPSLQGLAVRNARRVRPADPDFHRDMNRVLADLGIKSFFRIPAAVILGLIVFCLLARFVIANVLLWVGQPLLAVSAEDMSKVMCGGAILGAVGGLIFGWFCRASVASTAERYLRPALFGALLAMVLLTLAAVASSWLIPSDVLKELNRHGRNITDMRSP